jgi:OmpA-OmpF porin, OOP family
VKKRLWSVFLAVALAGSSAGCANRQTPAPESLQPVPVDPSAYSKKADTFIVVLDTASSMERTSRKRLEADHAHEIVSRMNRMIPALDYRAGLVAFESGSCLSCDDAVVLYGLSAYNRDEFAAGLARHASAVQAGRSSAMGGGAPASRSILERNPGRTALIVVSDSENILHGRTFKTVQKLKGVLGERLCIYPILMDRDCDGRAVMAALVNVGGCGFAVGADEIALPQAMARYVQEVLLSPAAAPVGAAPFSGMTDSDGDGVPDGRDRCPNTPKGARVNADGCWELQVVYFDSDQAVIKDTRVLDDAAIILKANPSLTGEVQGHADSTASAEHNQTLSEARARAVRDYLIRQGVAPDRIAIKGYGETRPAASNDSLEGRALNRRVELQPGRR